ncbi:transcription factor with ap2 domain [Cystoisospora suis]|uniref:Transcription factor with ap2 domain n=1 Tax=Cystoisospora suis TaxID=483139 RepID=A0A2C6KG13_9APIC|nr:transcription factor with ap2 domain [Cystoisospora suis]
MYRCQADSRGVMRKWLSKPSAWGFHGPSFTRPETYCSFLLRPFSSSNGRLIVTSVVLASVSRTPSNQSCTTVTAEGTQPHAPLAQGRACRTPLQCAHPRHRRSQSNLALVSPSRVANPSSTFLSSFLSPSQSGSASSPYLFLTQRAFPPVTLERAASSRLEVGVCISRGCQWDPRDPSRKEASSRLEGAVELEMRQAGNTPRWFQCSRQQMSEDCSRIPGRNGCFVSGQRRFFSAHPYKPKSREVFHPHVPAPEHLPPPDYTTARLDPRQQFIPKDFYRDVRVDTLRDGVNLGSDFPWNVTHKWRYWRRRKYNIQADDRFIRLSPITGVDYYKRLNVFAVQWRENGQHRIRWFRAAYGLNRALRAAERFRQTLEVTGRVDNWRTARHLREQMLERRQQLKLRKKRFSKISSGQF